MKSAFERTIWDACFGQKAGRRNKNREPVARTLGEGSNQSTIRGQSAAHPSPNFLDYFFTPKTPSFAALATRKLTTVLAGILIFCCVFGLKPVRAFLFCFTSFPKSGKTNSPFFFISL